MPEEQLPAPVEGASDVAKFASAIGAAAIELLFPGLGAIASMGAAAVNLAADRYQNRPQAILLDQLRAGDLSVLTDFQKAAFVPMSFRFFEAARQGEYEHNLEILAAYIAGELKQETPGPGAVGGVARRIEGLSKFDLRIISCIETLRPQNLSDQRLVSQPYGFTPSMFFNECGKRIGFDMKDIFNSFYELTNRNLLHINMMQGYGTTEPSFATTRAFFDLIAKAKAKIDALAS